VHQWCKFGEHPSRTFQDIVLTKFARHTRGRTDKQVQKRNTSGTLHGGGLKQLLLGGLPSEVCLRNTRWHDGCYCCDSSEFLTTCLPEHFISIMTGIGPRPIGVCVFKVTRY